MYGTKLRAEIIKALRASKETLIASEIADKVVSRNSLEISPAEWARLLKRVRFHLVRMRREGLVQYQIIRTPVKTIYYTYTF